jgi:hypothetical protein
MNGIADLLAWLLIAIKYYIIPVHLHTQTPVHHVCMATSSNVCSFLGCGFAADAMRLP